MKLGEGHFFFIPIPFVSGVTGGDGIGVYAPQYLAMEFNPNGRLLRYKYFARWTASPDDQFYDKIFPEWLNELRSDYN